MAPIDQAKVGKMREMSKPEVDGVFMGICAVCDRCAKGDLAEPDNEDEPWNSQFRHSDFDCPADKIWRMVSQHRMQAVPPPPITGSNGDLYMVIKSGYDRISKLKEEESEDTHAVESVAFALLYSLHHWTMLRREGFAEVIEALTRPEAESE